MVAARAGVSIHLAGLVALVDAHVAEVVPVSAFEGFTHEIRQRPAGVRLRGGRIVQRVGENAPAAVSSV